MDKIDEIVERWRFVDLHGDTVKVTVTGSRSPEETIEAIFHARDDVALLTNEIYRLRRELLEVDEMHGGLE